MGKTLKDQSVDLDENTLEVESDSVEINENDDLQKKAKEDIDAIFSGEELSEDFKKNAQAIFEAAVLARVSELSSSIEEEYAAKLEEAKEEFSSSLIEKVDEYLDYVVSEWAEENKLAIQKNLKAEIAEDFMIGLKNLFIENYVDIPEDKVDIFEEVTSKLSQAEDELDKSISENVKLVEELNGYKKEKLISQITEGLTDVQCEKLKSLAENIEFISEEDYKEKLILTKKKYFDSKEEVVENVVSEQKTLDSDSSELDESYSPIMEHYVKNLSKIVKK